MKNKPGYFLLLPLFVLLFGCYACKDKHQALKTNLDVTFKAAYDGSQLEKYKDYAYGTNAYPLQFTRFNIYLSDITLVKSDGTEHRLSEIEYLDFTPDNATSDLSATPTFTFPDVPEGEYASIRMGYGVKPELNAKSPAQYPVGHPLYLESEYWPGWDSYIFSKIEGQGDQDKNGTFDHYLLLHPGSDAVYKTYTYHQPIHVHAGQAGLHVIFDLKKLFQMEDGSFYDIVTNSATSNDPNNVVVAQVLMSNFDNATTVQQ